MTRTFSKLLLWRQVRTIQSVEMIKISRDKIKKKDHIPENGMRSPVSERNDRFAFFHEQAGNDADDTDEEAVDAHQQD